MVQISKSDWKIRVKYSKNTRPKLEVKPWGILVILPEGVDEKEAYKFIEKHKSWIEKRHTELLEALENSEKIELIDRNNAEFKNLIEKLVEQATNDVLGMNPCKIVIRRMKYRWASISPKGTLSINTLVKYLPEYLISYIIYHEICHILEPKHNKEFWMCVKRWCPNYKELEKELLIYEVKLGLYGSVEKT